MTRRVSLGLFGLLALVALLLLLLRPTVTAPAEPAALDPVSGLPVVELVDLPLEARQTLALIEHGGPFPYAADASVLGKRERLLTHQDAGVYREYTVPTPAEDDRGPRRIVTGDRNRVFYYTADHYASFVRVRR